MKIKVKVPSQRLTEVGKVVDLPPEIAQNYIDGGYADPVKETKNKKKQKEKPEETGEE